MSKPIHHCVPFSSRISGTTDALGGMIAAQASGNEPDAVDARFSAWEQSMIIDNCREALLSSLTYQKDMGQPSDISPKELRYFRSIAGEKLALGTDGQLEMHSIMQHLVEQPHPPEMKLALQQNTKALETLILSHASYPFTGPVKLIADVLCRSLILLTNRCMPNFFGYGTFDGGEFIFSSLTQPPHGAPDRSAVLDVLERLGYPAQLDSRGQRLCRPREDFVPLAERLAPVKEWDRMVPMPAATFQ